MSGGFALIAAVFLALLGSLNYYVLLRGWQWLGAVGLAPAPWVYWAPLTFLASAFLLAKVAGRFLPRSLTRLLAVIGACWLLVLFYTLPVLAVIDLGRVANQWLRFVPGANAIAVAQLLGGAVLLLITGLLLYGFWSARTPVVVRHDISVAKPGGKHKALHVVLVSDTHLGQINGVDRARAMVAMVNRLRPDIVLIAGDLIDDDMGPFAAQNMAAELKRLNAPLGIYSILGNHDYPDGYSPAFRRQMERAGIRLLIDEAVQVDDSLYIVGRDDIAGRRISGRTRKPLPDLLEGVDRSLPLVLMDHQPYRLEEAEQAGIDLQVSGHTHRGQMFPNHLLTRRVFELDWGYLKKGATHVVVSLGFGTWGPPVRIGNRPEVVSIQMRFEHA
jgi:uncharacterized protein